MKPSASKSKQSLKRGAEKNTEKKPKKKADENGEIKHFYDVSINYLFILFIIFFIGFIIII